MNNLKMNRESVTHLNFERLKFSLLGELLNGLKGVIVGEGVFKYCFDSLFIITYRS